MSLDLTTIILCIILGILCLFLGILYVKNRTKTNGSKGNDTNGIKGDDTNGIKGDDTNGIKGDDTNIKVKARRYQTVSISGGGTRSFTAAHSLVQWLGDELYPQNMLGQDRVGKVFKNFTDISGVSGGGWFAACIGYSPKFVNAVYAGGDRGRAASVAWFKNMVPESSNSISKEIDLLYRAKSFLENSWGDFLAKHIFTGGVYEDLYGRNLRGKLPLFQNKSIIWALSAQKKFETTNQNNTQQPIVYQVKEIPTPNTLNCPGSACSSVPLIPMLAGSNPRKEIDYMFMDSRDGVYNISVDNRTVDNINMQNQGITKNYLNRVWDICITGSSFFGFLQDNELMGKIITHTNSNWFQNALQNLLNTSRKYSKPQISILSKLPEYYEFSTNNWAVLNDWPPEKVYNLSKQYKYIGASDGGTLENMGHSHVLNSIQKEGVKTDKITMVFLDTGWGGQKNMVPMNTWESFGRSINPGLSPLEFDKLGDQSWTKYVGGSGHLKFTQLNAKIWNWDVNKLKYDSINGETVPQGGHLPDGAVRYMYFEDLVTIDNPFYGIKAGTHVDLHVIAINGQGVQMLPFTRDDAVNLSALPQKVKAFLNDPKRIDMKNRILKLFR